MEIKIRLKHSGSDIYLGHLYKNFIPVSIIFDEAEHIEKVVILNTNGYATVENSCGYIDIILNNEKHEECSLYFFKESYEGIPAGTILPLQSLTNDEKEHGTIITNHNLDGINYFRYLINQKYPHFQNPLNSEYIRYPTGQCKIHGIYLYNYKNARLSAFNVSTFFNNRNCVDIFYNILSRLPSQDMKYRKYITEGKSPYTKCIKPFLFPELGGME